MGGIFDWGEGRKVDKIYQIGVEGVYWQVIENKMMQVGNDVGRIRLLKIMNFNIIFIRSYCKFWKCIIKEIFKKISLVYRCKKNQGQEFGDNKISWRLIVDMN